MASTLSVVAVLILLAAFVYLLRQRSALSVLLPKFSGEPRKSPSNLRLFFLRVKGTSFQVEPAGADEVTLLECCDMGPSRAAGDGVVAGREFQQAYNHGRLLYTIREEKETESESEDESVRFIRVSPSPSAVEAVVTRMAPATAEEGEDGDGCFFTPCYTPSSSPLSVVWDIRLGGRRGFAGVEGGRRRRRAWRSGTRGARS